MANIEDTKANLMREILFVRDEYRRAVTDEAHDSAKRYHDELMKEFRELTGEGWGCEDD